MNWIPAAQIIPFGCCGAFSVKGYGWFFVSGPAIIKIFMINLCRRRREALMSSSTAVPSVIVLIKAAYSHM